MSAELVSADYDGMPVHFTDAAWFNATEVAERFGKRIQNWLDNQETKDYLAALTAYRAEHNHSKESDLNRRNSGDLIKTKRGKAGGTWLHPDLAVPFARWLDVRFGVWCDQQIKGLLAGSHPHYDWKRMRHASTASNKVMALMLTEVRKMIGKETAAHHYINEAKLVNYALTGEFKAVDRDQLTVAQLDLLATLEQRNTILIGRGVERETRKAMLEQHAADWLAAHQPLPLAVGA